MSMLSFIVYENKIWVCSDNLNVSPLAKKLY